MIATHNAVVVVWWCVEGVIYTYVVDVTTTNPKFPVTTMTKIPGGRSKPGETPWQTAKREFKEEVGLEIGSTANPMVIYDNRKKIHRKMGFLVHRSTCSGRIRREARDEKNSHLGAPRAVSLEEAIRVVHKTPKNEYHPNTLVNAWVAINQMNRLCTVP